MSLFSSKPRATSGVSHVEVLILISILAILGLAVWVRWHNPPTTPNQANLTLRKELQRDLLNGPAIDPAIPSAPRLEFAEYVLDEQVTLPTLPPTVKVYPLRTNFTVKQVLVHPQKLGLELDPNYSNPDAFAFTNFNQPENLGYWVTSPQTGAFEFQSFGNRQAASAQDFLKTIGLWDDALVLSAQEKDFPNSSLTRYIFHRDWEKMGLPIVNSAGLLNTDQKIAQLTPTAATDFNTIEVLMSDDGRVWAINSNLRPFAGKPLILAAEQLKTPQEALSKLRAGKGIFQLSAPIGEGSVDYNQVYPGGVARAQKAIINDLALVYLEKHRVAQKYLQPVYVVRGTAQLESGYTVKWSQVVPAVKETSGVSQLKMNLAKLTHLIWAYARPSTPGYEPASTGINVPGLGVFVLCGESHTYCFRATTEQGRNTTLGELRDKFFNLLAEEFMITLSQNAINNPQLLSQIHSLKSEEDAYQLFRQLNGISSESNGCTAAIACRADAAPIRKPPESEQHLMCWNYIDDRVNQMAQGVAWSLLSAINLAEPSPTGMPSPSFSPTPTHPSPSLLPTPEIFMPLVPSSLSLDAWAQRDHIFSPQTRHCISYTYFPSGPRNDTLKAGSYAVAVRITGESPVIFARNAPENLSIKLPQEKLTYKEPFMDGRLYYEFNPAKVELEADRDVGVIGEFRATRVDEFARNLARTWQLTPAETNALTTDLNRAASEVGSKYLKIQLATRASLDRELPLTISPAPDHITRIHLLVSKGETGKEELEKPVITPLDRNGFTVIELGASHE